MDRRELCDFSDDDILEEVAKRDLLLIDAEKIALIAEGLGLEPLSPLARETAREEAVEAAEARLKAAEETAKWRVAAAKTRLKAAEKAAEALERAKVAREAVAAVEAQTA